METYEFEGKNDEDAIENACRQLNLSREEFDIEIIEPGSAGIFGLVGGRKAKIKVSVTKEEPELPEEKSQIAVAKETLSSGGENGVAVAKRHWKISWPSSPWKRPRSSLNRLMAQ